MTMSTFKMTPGLKEKLEKAARTAMEDVTGDYQKMFDALGRRCEGRPVSEIRLVLRREVKRLGGTFSEAELTKYATLISEGTSIKMRLK